MRFLQTTSMAIKAIFHNKMRSFLTMLGIIIGVMSVITLVSVIQGVQRKTLEQFAMNADVISAYYYSNTGTGRDITNEFTDFCTTMSDLIVGMSPNKTAHGTAVRYREKTNQNTQVVFASNSYDDTMGFELEAGRSISYSDIKNHVNVAVIGSYVKEEFFGYEDPIGKKIKIKGVDYTVVGVYKSRYNDIEWSRDNAVAVPMSLQRTILGTEGYNEFSIKAKDGDSTTLAIEKITIFFQNTLGQNGMKYYYYVYSDNQFIDQQNEYITMMSAVVGGIAGISLLVGGIGIMNIMLVSVAERTREIGIRMAIGAKRRSIIGQFLIEAASISAIGGLIGIAFGALGSALLSAFLLKEVFFPSAPIVMGAFIFSISLGIFFGLYPAGKASKMQPVEALRNN